METKQLSKCCDAEKSYSNISATDMPKIGTEICGNCMKPFIPQEKEKGCDNLVAPLPKEDWITEFDEKCMKIARLADKGNGTEVGMKLIELRKIFSSIHDRAFKEGYTKGVNDTHDVLEPLKIAKNNFDVGREQGRQDVKVQLFKMLDSSELGDKIMGLLTNLTPNEEDKKGK